MFLESAVSDIFGSWWGIFEFLILVLIVVVISHIGVKILLSNFTRNEKTGKLRTAPLEEPLLFNTVIRAVDATTTTYKKQETEYADDDVAKAIHRCAKKEIEENVAAAKQPDLLDKVIKRTAMQIGLKIKNQRTEFSDMPFKTIDVRINASSSSSVAKLTILDGILPKSVLLPFYIVITVTDISTKEEEEEEEPDLRKVFPELSSWPPPYSNMVKTNASTSSKTTVFDNIRVESLKDGILLDAKDKLKAASLFNPHNKLKIKMEAKKDGSKVLLYEGETRVSSPLPRVVNIMSCKNFSLMRIDEPVSPYYELTQYSQDTLSDKYVSEYPHHMPELSEAASEAASAAPSVVNHSPNDNDNSLLKKPAAVFIYGRKSIINQETGEQAPLPTLTHDLYNREIKTLTQKHHNKYVIKPAEKIIIIRDPSRPSERYMSMSLAKESIPPEVKLMGWVVGFESPGGVLSGDGVGYNIIFPINHNATFSDLSFEDAVTASSREGIGDAVVLHNTDTHVGCFGNEENLSSPDLTGWPGPVNGKRYFSYHLRPVIVIRWKQGAPPKIGAVMSSPATEYAGEKTGLLPRNLAVTEGPLPAVDAIQDKLQMAVLGGTTVHFVKERFPENIYAVFPPLRTKDGLVNEPYRPLHDLLSRNNTSVLAVRKIVTKGTDGGNAVIKVFDKVTGVVLGGTMIALEGGVKPIFVDGARDDRPFCIDVCVFGKGHARMPVKPPGIYLGKFSNMDEPEKEKELWENPMNYKPTPTITYLTNKGAAVVFCRTTLPPISDRGKRDPFMKMASLVCLPASVPSWAFVGSLEAKFPRHIFISSIRNSDCTNEIRNPNGSLFSPEKWLRGNLHIPSYNTTTTTATREYMEGERAYARVFMGQGATDQQIDQTVEIRNKASLIVTENGTHKENLLANDETEGGRLIGNWGIIVFGSNPHPDEPADRYTNWRTKGRLRMVVADIQKGTPSISQPVTLLHTRLATWPRGEPVLKSKGGDTLVRLDPRLGGVGSANGFYNKNTGPDPGQLTNSLLFVLFDASSRKVKYVERAPLYWKLLLPKRNRNDDITKNLKPIDRNSAAQRRLWNRTMFNHDRLFLCVKVPDAAKTMEGTAMFVDQLVFACSASLATPQNRADFYKKFIAPPLVIYNKNHSSYEVYVPFNFSTMCGFVI